MVLESAEAGLSWLTVLKKRANYQLAYDGFNPEKVACYDSKKAEELLMNAGIIRSKAKITSSVQNAKKFIEIQKQYGSFSNYIWSYVGHKPILNNWNNSEEVPSRTNLSDTICADMKTEVLPLSVLKSYTLLCRLWVWLTITLLIVLDIIKIMFDS